MPTSEQVVWLCIAGADTKRGDHIILSARVDGTRIATPADNGLDGVAIEDAEKDTAVQVVVSGVYV